MFQVLGGHGMAGQTGMSTPIFDELLREMTEGLMPPASPAQSGAGGNPDPDPARNTPPAPRRRHRAD
jgi:hypothetical protein